jgi:hypothetical protein
VNKFKITHRNIEENSGSIRISNKPPFPLEKRTSDNNSIIDSLKPGTD